MSADAGRVAAVIVTHNSERFLPELIASIQGQTRTPDAVIVIDDHSTDQTIDMLRLAGWRVEAATSSATDTTTRIAQNFTQGVRAVRDFDIAILGDHDDYWLPDRVDHQVHQLAKHPSAWMLASGARIMGSNRTLRDTFPVPDYWADMSRGRRLRYALRHSIATGGASAVRPRQLLDPVNETTTIPAGWLHDRWWSLAATAKDALIIEPHSVIEYRVQSNQQVGLDRGRQGRKVLRLQVNDVVRARQALNLLKLRAN